jgi:hypothetical protein
LNNNPGPPEFSIAAVALPPGRPENLAWMIRKPRIEKANEADIAFGVLVIAAFQPSGIASFHRLRREIPIHVRLSSFDTAESITRPNEENWIQTLRHITANRHLPGNFIYEGYLTHIPRVGFRITSLGFRRRMRGRHG